MTRINIIIRWRTGKRRFSIKEKLAEKKVVIEQRDKAGKEVPEKGTEKKSEREI